MLVLCAVQGVQILLPSEAPWGATIGPKVRTTQEEDFQHVVRPTPSAEEKLGLRRAVSLDPVSDSFGHDGPTRGKHANKQTAIGGEPILAATEPQRTALVRWDHEIRSAP